MELRGGRGQRTDTRRYADCDIEHVVDHQCGCGEQPGIGAEILSGHGVGAGVARVSLYRLPIGDEEHQQQYQNGEHDRAERAQPGRPRRHQQEQRGLGAVGRGAEPVEPHGCEAFDRGDLAALRFAIGQPAPDQNADEVHPGSLLPPLPTGKHDRSSGVPVRLGDDRRGDHILTR
jgi:hypothetical protein